jgi:predicted component of type VI protein secretion system
MIRKLVLNDGRSERELVLKGTLVVGRDPSCHVNDLDPLLSRRHAEFVSGLQGVLVRDLGSRNGILVNGVKVPQQILSSGDVVQLGHLELRYVEDTSAQAVEHHARAHATTASGIEAPTMAPPPRPQPAARPVPAAVAPTESMPAAPVPSSPALGDDDATGAFSAAMAAAGRGPAAAPAGRAAAMKSNEDIDETRAPGAKPVAPLDPDATMAPSGLGQSPGRPALVEASSMDDTRMPHGRSAPAAAVPGGDTGAAAGEARIAADRSLIVTEANGSCTAMLGLRPETVIGGQLTEALARALSFVAGGQGPSPLTMSVTRGMSSGSLIITFKTGQA